MKKGLSKTTMERLLRETTGLRISDGAKDALKNALETYAENIGEKAARFASHAGRKTIKEEDIVLATRQN